jgi:small subunit ribosomal protein S17
MPRRILQGTVVSDKGNKTVTVKVERRITHPVYGKIVTVSKKYAAHDEDNKSVVGDSVKIRECRPVSKRKHWEVVYENDEKSKVA